MHGDHSGVGRCPRCGHDDDQRATPLPGDEAAVECRHCHYVWIEPGDGAGPADVPSARPVETVPDEDELDLRWAEWMAREQLS